MFKAILSRLSQSKANTNYHKQDCGCRLLKPRSLRPTLCALIKTIYSFHKIMRFDFFHNNQSTKLIRKKIVCIYFINSQL